MDPVTATGPVAGVAAGSARSVGGERLEELELEGGDLRPTCSTVSRGGPRPRPRPRATNEAEPEPGPGGRDLGAGPA